MKKFLNVRNILILVIIIIAIIFVLLGRSSDINTSKAYQLFKTFTDYDVQNGYSETTLTLNYSDETIDLKFIYATDSENERELYSVIINKDDDEIAAVDEITEITKIDHTNYQLVGIITENGLDAYYLYPNSKLCVTYDTQQKDTAGYYASWSSNLTNEMTNSNYYTKGYEFIDGKLISYEYFKDAGLKFYFDNDELIYMKIASLDNSMSSSTVNYSDLRLYSVSISHESFDNSLIEIPEDYEVKNATEMQQTITTE